MTYTLCNTCAKYLCKRTLLVQLIIKKWSHVFGTQCRMVLSSQKSPVETTLSELHARHRAGANIPCLQARTCLEIRNPCLKFGNPCLKFWQMFHHCCDIRVFMITPHFVIMPPPRRGAGALSGDRRPSSVCLMSRTSALTRKPKALGSRNFAQGYPRSHATPTPTSRSKGQKSRSRGRGHIVAAT